MRVVVTDDLVVEYDSSCWVVRARKVAQKGAHAGEERWEAASYHSTLGDALARCWRQLLTAEGEFDLRASDALPALTDHLIQCREKVLEACQRVGAGRTMNGGSLAEASRSQAKKKRSLSDRSMREMKRESMSRRG